MDKPINQRQERILVERLEYYTCLLYRLMELTGEANHQEAMKRVEEAIEFQRAMKEAEGSKVTSQQREILRLAHEGLTSREMAQALCVSKRTIDYHFSNIYQKFGCRNRVEMIQIAARRGLL